MDGHLQGPCYFLGPRFKTRHENYSNNYNGCSQKYWQEVTKDKEILQTAEEKYSNPETDIESEEETADNTEFRWANMVVNSKYGQIW